MPRTETLTEQLGQWRAWLARLDLPSAPLLLPGRSRAEIEAALGPGIPDAVVEWFACCDGVADAPGQTVDEAYTMPWYWHASLDEALAVKAAHSGGDDPLLAGAWLPLLVCCGTDLYAAVWTDGAEPAVAAVLPEAGPAAIEFDSIAQLAAVVNACFANGAFHRDAAGHLDLDDDRYEQAYQAVVGRPVPG
ncbi:hypothetical protein Cs7R123_41640 [Catellatospora sp. TT07R-123]|uniref:hypothetical protein n=1 Tax=Catellatospora sp. TT07R-123 TaxID=2733863 RepID=UPI001B16C46B|nr:hypothetical protein [Catellatospora sp. TT07R-123]GHJ46822.1 hypothetical protein Cs7R123_41640 [Catellatospora sp. TT07R-123]